MTSETMTGTYTLTLADELGQIPVGYRIELPGDATAGEVGAHLTEVGVLPGRTPSGQPLTYDVSYAGDILIHDQRLDEQGVPAVATLRIHNKNIQGTDATLVA